jgi:octaprenyl-diphosphate synthase
MQATVPTLPQLYGPIDTDLEIVRQKFDDELSSDLPFVNEYCQTIRSYRGKMLRPSMLLLAAKACGEIRPEHHALAAVVEMVHMATLVHDDVLDEAEERRRRPTIRALSGNVAAVLFGDYLISHAFHLCSSLGDSFASRQIGATTNAVCEGELLQNHHCHDLKVTEADYLEIIRRKTGALTAVSCELGAAYTGADEPIVKAFRDYGLYAGIAFQIVDDLLDLVGNAGEVGKTLGLDLHLGKLTLPTIHCLGNADQAIVAALTDALQGRSHPDRSHVYRWLQATSSIEYSRSVAESFVQNAIQRITVVLPSDAKSSLVALAEFITRRTF